MYFLNLFVRNLTRTLLDLYWISSALKEALCVRNNALKITNDRFLNSQRQFLDYNSTEHHPNGKTVSTNYIPRQISHKITYSTFLYD